MIRPTNVMTSNVTRFFSSVFWDGAPGNSFVWLGALPADGWRRPQFLRLRIDEAPEALRDWARRWDGVMNVHAAPALFFNDPPRRVEASVQCVRAVWADLDTPGGRPELAAFPEPSYVAETSPGRFHLAWRLHEPASPDTARRVMRMIARLIGADPAVCAPNALLRVPGTRNMKLRRPDWKVRMVVCDPARTLGIDDLEASLSSFLFGPGDGGIRHSDGESATLRRSPAFFASASGMTRMESEVPPEVVACGTRAVELWAGLARFPRCACRREWVLALMLADAQVPPERIAKILVSSPNARTSNEFARRGRSYWTRRAARTAWRAVEIFLLRRRQHAEKVVLPK